MYSGYSKSVQICTGAMHVIFQDSGFSWGVQEWQWAEDEFYWSQNDSFLLRKM